MPAEYHVVVAGRSVPVSPATTASNALAARRWSPTSPCATAAPPTAPVPSAGCVASATFGRVRAMASRVRQNASAFAMAVPSSASVI